MDKLPEAGIDALPGLLEALNDPYHGARRIAVRNIGRFGSAAAPHVYEIASLLNDPNMEVKQAAIWALGETGVTAVPMIVQALNCPDSKPAAKRALWKLHPQTFNSVVLSSAPGTVEQEVCRSNEYQLQPDSPGLEIAITHPDFEIRLAGIYCLGQMKKMPAEISKLEFALTDENTTVQLGAAATIGRHLGWQLDTEEHPKLFRALLDCLANKNLQVSSGAMHVLATMDEPTVPFLCDQLLSSETDFATKLGILRSLPDLDDAAGVSLPAIRASLTTNPMLCEGALLALGKLCNGHPETQEIFLAALAVPQTQIAAVQALEYMGDSACFAGKMLIQLLEAKDDELRRAAQNTLTAIGKDIVPLLLEELKTKNVKRESVMSVLAMLGSNAAGAVNELVILLQGEEISIACQAATTLGRIGSSASDAVLPLAKALNAGNIQLADKAAFALGMLGDEAVPALLKALSAAKGSHAKILVIEALGNVTPPSDATILPIANLIFDDDQGVQSAAATVLVNIGSPAAAGIEIYEKALMHHSRTVRSHAAKILSKLGPDAVSAIPALIKTLQLGRIPARKLAALALAKLAGLSPRIVPALQRMLRSHDQDIVVAACISLGGIGKTASPAVPAIIKTLGHRKAKHNPEYRLVSGGIIREASTALTKIGESAVPAIVKSLMRRNVNILDELLSLIPIWGAYEASRVSKPRTRGYLVGVLQEIGSEASEAVPILCQIIQDSDSDLRARAEAALTAIGTIEESEIRILARALLNRNTSVRAHTASVLGSFGRISRLAVPELMRILRDKDSGVRKKAIVSLGKIGTAARGSVGPLLKLLSTADLEQAHLVTEAVTSIGANDRNDAQAIYLLANNKDPNQRWHAAAILSELQELPKEAILVLKRLAEDSDQNIAQAAEIALGKR